MTKTAKSERGIIAKNQKILWDSIIKILENNDHKNRKYIATNAIIKILKKHKQICI